MSSLGLELLFFHLLPRGGSESRRQLIHMEGLCFQGTVALRLCVPRGASCAYPAQLMLPSRFDTGNALTAPQGDRHFQRIRMFPSLGCGHRRRCFDRRPFWKVECGRRMHICMHEAADRRFRLCALGMTLHAAMTTRQQSGSPVR